MASPHDNDPALARFRRGAGSHVGPPGPPPVPGAAAVPGAQGAPIGSGLGGPGELITTGSVPGWAGAGDPAIPPPLFGELLDPGASARPEPLYDAPDQQWVPTDDDPGRRPGIVSIVVGFFVGIVGLFIGVYAIRRSREADFAGALGVVGVIVSALSILVVGAIGLSWVRYEVDVATQCSLVGPGHYLTSSGSEVTCH